MVNLGTKEGMSGGWQGVKRTGTGAEEEAMARWGSGLKNLGLGFEEKFVDSNWRKKPKRGEVREPVKKVYSSFLDN